MKPRHVDAIREGLIRIRRDAADVIGDSLNGPFGIHAGQNGAASSENLISTSQLILMFELCARDSRNSGAQCQFIIITGGSPVPACQLHDDEIQATFFHAAVIPTLGPVKLGSSHFEVAGIVRMMQETHGIGFAVADSYADIMFLQTKYPPLDSRGRPVAFGKSPLTNLCKTCVGVVSSGLIEVQVHTVVQVRVDAAVTAVS